MLFSSVVYAFAEAGFKQFRHVDSFVHMKTKKYVEILQQSHFIVLIKGYNTITRAVPESDTS